MTGDEVFDRLKRSSGFEEADQGAKRSILRDVWPREAARLRHKFGPTGISPNGDIGIGFLMEELAKRSKQLPLQNSPEENGLARRILRSLHHGDMRVASIARRPNPDILWLRRQNGVCTLQGIGEIKASARALANSREQLEWQEKTMHEFCDAVRRDRARGIADSAFRDMEVSLAKPFLKYAIVPRGAKGSALRFLPPGWKCAQIEFSRMELLFLAREIWPQFESETLGRVSEDIVRDTRVGFVKTFLEWAYPLVGYIIDETDSLPSEIVKRMTLFACATKHLPVGDPTALLVTDKMLIKPAMEALFEKRPAHILRHAQLNEQEKAFHTAFYAFADDTEQILCFLSWMRELRERLISARDPLPLVECDLAALHNNH